MGKVTVDKLGNRVLAVTALVAPTIAAVAVRFVSHAPGAAVAAPMSVEEAPAVISSVTPEPSLTTEQRKVLELSAAPVMNEMASPFLTAFDPGSAAPEFEPSQATVEKAAPKPMVLTSVFSGRTTGAIINGKARAVGDEVEPGWRVFSIDPQEGIVVVKNKQEKLTLRIHRLPRGAE